MILPTLASLMTGAALVLIIYTKSWVGLNFKNRIMVMSSRERCPTLKSNSICSFEIMARRGDEWLLCDSHHAPSGADLPMRRWFKIKVSCELKLAGITYGFQLPSQKILR